MDDPDATAAVPGPTPPGGVRLSDAALGALFDAASPAFATQPTTSSRHWQPPTVEVLQQALPQYEISAFIARGGMGAVYQGVQRSLHRPVAVKVLPQEMEEGDLQFAERFKREAQSMAQLSHPNIVAVYDAGETSDGLLYFVMEYIEGTDVARLIASERHLDPQRAMSITSSVCDALAFAHEAGIIHRDIKPSNIMIDRKGRVKVADFGLAKALDAGDGTLLTMSRVAVGTPDFIAPEAHIAGMVVDQRADLYAVGVMLYQMLTGRIPRGRFDPPSSLIPQIDPRLDAIVDKAMQTERDKRYSTAQEMKTDVERVSQGSVADGSADTPVRTHQTGGEAAKGQEAHRSLRAPLLIAAGFIALAAGGLFLLQSDSKPDAAAGRSAAPALPSEAASAPKQVPGAAGPGASIAAYPPGQWVEVFSKPEDVPPNAQGAADLQWSEGWLVPGQMPLRLAFPGADTNHGMRARFRFRGQDMYENFLQLRVKGPAGYVFRLTTDGQCTIALMKPGGSGAVSGPLFAGGRPARESEIIATATLPAPLKAGEEYRLEFLAVGSRLIGRFNGQVVCEASDTRLPAGQSSIYGYAPMRDIAVMALDKLPEAEALKAAGVDATALTARVWRDALAEPPLNAVATRANDPGGSFLFPINRHWLFPSTKVTAGMVRWRGVMDGSRWPVLFVTESNGSGIKADVFDVEMKAGLLDARNPDELRTLAKSMPVEALMNPGRHQAELALLRLGGRLHMLIDGQVVVDCADPLSGPVRFGFITHSDKPSTATLDYLVLDGLSEAEALKVAGVTLPDVPSSPSSTSRLPSPVTVSSARYPPGQWVRPYQKATDIHQKWFDAGAKWEEGWITPGAGFNQSISLGAPNAQGRNWGARARIRCGGEGFAGLVLRRNGTATSNTVSNYELRVTQKGGAEFVRGQGRGSVSGADRKPLGDPFPIPLIDGQEVLIEAFAIGDTLYGRVDGKVFTMKTDGMLKEGGFEVATQIMPVRDIEFINLDGLTEAEALKTAGVGE